MGLCKCPKRNVTNQFCFEHRVNVCQNCMVTIHPNCIVQSYLQWLQDSDYSPICQLCKNDLYSNDCIRLTCFHVFHWDCLNEYVKNLPDDSAVSNYVCPTCKEPIVPQNNLVSPVADVIREKLKSVNWARRVLQLPLLTEEVTHNEKIPSSQKALYDKSQSLPKNNTSSAINMSNVNDLYVGINNSNFNVRRGINPEYSTLNLLDNEENKYERKASRFRFFNGENIRKNGKLLRVLCIFSLLILLYMIGSSVSRGLDSNSADIDEINPHY